MTSLADVSPLRGASRPPSGKQDSNLRLPRPKRGALTKLSYYQKSPPGRSRTYDLGLIRAAL